MYIITILMELFLNIYVIAKYASLNFIDYGIHHNIWHISTNFINVTTKIIQLIKIFFNLILYRIEIFDINENGFLCSI